MADKPPYHVHKALRGSYKKANEEIKDLRAALKDCADDLEEYVNAHYPENVRKQYPSEELRYQRDMASVKKARELLNG